MNSSIIFYNTTANNNVTQSQSEDQGILMVFRSVHVLEKTVESCLMRVSLKEAKTKIELRCKHSVIKTYTLPFIESESLKVMHSIFHFSKITLKS